MITIRIPTATEFWAGLARLAYRRWAARMPADAKKPVGVPGNRDPEHPCTAYSPRPKRAGDWGNCGTDGHYLCDECCHRAEMTQRDQDHELDRAAT